MIEREVRLINQLGLHARAASQLVRVAGNFKSIIKIYRQDNFMSADAKSILNILTLAASRGTVLKVTIEGEDETEAAREVEKLFTEGFGEL